MTPDQKRLWVILGLVTLLLTTSLIASIAFQSNYVGWLADDVTDPMAFRNDWERILASAEGIEHPAVIHFQPEGCLCFALSARHAAQISSDADRVGLTVYQLNSTHDGLGAPLTVDTGDLPFGPLIAITSADGSLRYAGAYSDGIRCNTGNSMVSTFIDPANSSNGQTVIGLDVTVCRCLQAGS